MIWIGRFGYPLGKSAANVRLISKHKKRANKIFFNMLMMSPYFENYFYKFIIKTKSGFKTRVKSLVRPTQKMINLAKN
ncbi:hypothetical protein PSHI8_04320 [Polynucleobacter sp. SHI8]|nr:hypothetical protein PSHI2_04320 [Polynucleobacter sp. SHI2]BDW12796.1 hypothetical protein PSHI8_04320 [Polynucleobacter sp. SHI8]